MTIVRILTALLLLVTGRHRGEVERITRVDGEMSDGPDISLAKYQSSTGETGDIIKTFQVEVWILFDFLIIGCYILLRSEVR